MFDTEDTMDKFEAMDKRRQEEAFYMPPSAIKVPEHIKEQFRTSGFYLKWVNYLEGGASNAKNIRKRMHPSEGYTFVRPDELEAEDLIMLGDTDQFMGSEIIANGDLVLMKVRIEQAEARRKYYQNRTKEQSDAIQQMLRENQISSQGSRQTVRTGKNAQFMT